MPVTTTGDAQRVTMRRFVQGLPREGRWILATSAIQTLGRGLTLPFTVIYVSEVRGVPLGTAGTLMGLVAVAALLVSGPTGHAVDRRGPWLVVAFGCVSQLLACVVLAFATVEAAFAVGFVLLGIAFGVSWPAFNALIARVVVGPARQQFYGVNFALVNLGIGVGGVVGGLFVDLTRPWTFSAIFLADAASMLVPLAVLLGPLRRLSGPSPAPTDATDTTTQAGSYRAIVRRPAVALLLLVTLFITFVGYGQMETGVPAFARQVSEVGTDVIGFAFAGNTVAIVAVQFLTLRLAAGRRRTHVLHAMTLIWAASWVILGATGLLPGGWQAAAGVVAFATLFGVGETAMQAALPAITNDLAPDHLRGRYNALTAIAFQTGGILAPIASGFLLQHGAWQELIGLVLGLLVVGSLGIVRLGRALPAHADGAPTPG